MNTKKVLFIGDSLCLPRKLPSLVMDEEVWVNIVTKELKYNFDFFHLLHPGLHTSMIRENLNNQLGAYSPDVIILQVGVVDCAPRSLKEYERKVISRLPNKLKHIILYFVKKYYSNIINIRNITYVCKKDFKSNLLALREYYNKAIFIIVPISPANKKYILKNPKIENNIKIYNQIIEAIFKGQFLGDMYAAHNIDDIYLEDNHHLNHLGNSIIANAVIKRMKTIYDI